MTTTSTKSLLSLAAAAVALSMAAATPVQARDGDLFDRKARGLSHTHKGGGQAQTGRSTGRQTASDWTLYSDAQSGAVLVYDLEANSNGIRRRKWTRD